MICKGKGENENGAMCVEKHEHGGSMGVRPYRPPMQRSCSLFVLESIRDFVVAQM